MNDRQCSEFIAKAIPGSKAYKLSINMVKDLLESVDNHRNQYEAALNIACKRWLGIW